MSDARERILARLRAHEGKDYALETPPERIPVDPVLDRSREALERRFIEEAEKVGVRVMAAADEAKAFDLLAELLAGEQQILGWAAELIPLAGYADWLTGSGIELSQQPEGDIRVGISGADAALSSTGSLILLSGPGRPRAASLLPELHIAIVRRESIVANLESWLAGQRLKGIDSIRAASNLIIISGPSRTADIGMELVLGAHGPRHLAVILVD